MNKILVTIVTVGFLLIMLVVGVHAVESQPPLTIAVMADGSVYPSDAGIQKMGNVYVLSGDLNATITVEREDCVLDGANHTLQGPGSSLDYVALTLMASNITVENLRVIGWKAGVYGAYNNNTIENNVFLDNNQAIAIYASDYVVQQNLINGSSTGILIDSGAVQSHGDNNCIINNQITKNTWAFDILNSNGTIITQNNVTENNVILTLGTQQNNFTDAGIHVIYQNSFINNKEVLNIPFGGPTVERFTPISPAGNWDNGAIGNYWDDYFEKNPNATEIDNSRIGDQPYLIEDNISWTRTYANGTYLEGIATLGEAVDNHPLMTASEVSGSTTIIKPTENPTSTSPAMSPSTSVPEFSSTTILFLAIVTILAGTTLKRLHKKKWGLTWKARLGRFQSYCSQ
jgi:parallel beta-helix repeat protein